MASNSKSPQVIPALPKAIRVILVEDNHDLRQSLSGYLRLNGIEVVDVPTGIAFYRALRAESFDIAILDVNLPDISGFTLAGELSAERRIGIIMLTARTARDDQVRGYGAGADLYLTKPVDSEALMLAVRNLANRIKGPPGVPVPVAAEPAVTPRGWGLDMLRQILLPPAGLPIQLTSREMMMLEHLARANGATVSRAALSEALGYDLRRDNRSIDAVLHRLRQKAQEAGTELPLHVVHAVGIRFNAALSML